MSALSGDRVRVSFMARRQKHIKEGWSDAWCSNVNQFVGRLRVDNDIAFLVTPENTFYSWCPYSEAQVKAEKTGWLC